MQLKREPGESKKQLAARAKGNKDLLKVARFWECPDGENCWDDWVRPLVEDMLVIDAASILVRKTFSGELAELRGWANQIQRGQPGYGGSSQGYGGGQQGYGQGPGNPTGR